MPPLSRLLNAAVVELSFIANSRKMPALTKLFMVLDRHPELVNEVETA